MNWLFKLHQSIPRILFFLGESSAAGSPSTSAGTSSSPWNSYRCSYHRTLDTTSQSFDFGRWILAQSSMSTSSSLGEVHGKLEWKGFRRYLVQYLLKYLKIHENSKNVIKICLRCIFRPFLKRFKALENQALSRNSREAGGDCARWYFLQEGSQIARILSISSDFSCLASACSCFANSIERCTPSWPSQQAQAHLQNDREDKSILQASLRCLPWICTVKQKPCIPNPENDLTPLGAMR